MSGAVATSETPERAAAGRGAFPAESARVDPLAFEAGETRLTLRRDLRFTFHRQEGQPRVVIEDPSLGYFYRVGADEYAFLSLFADGATLDEAVEQSATHAGAAAFSRREALTVARWLLEAGLAHAAQTQAAARLLAAAEPPPPPAASQFNWLFVKQPLFHPDPWLAPWTCLARALCGAPAGWLWLATCVSGAAVAWFHRAELTAEAEALFSPVNWLWLALGGLALKLIHELAHALACKSQGCHVREAGVVWVLLAPLPYVDVTSSWRLPSKWRRAAIAVAGMRAELFVAACAAWVWAHTPPGVLHSQAYNALLLGSVTTVLVNANPLMRFDGYHALADIFETPNLYARGQQWLGYWARRYLLGLPATPPRSSPRVDALCQLHGAAAGVWRVVVMAGILAAACALFRGAGALLALLAGLAWLVDAARRARQAAAPGARRPSLAALARVTLLAAGALAAAAAALLWLPAPVGRTAHAVLAHAEAVDARADAAGFVVEIRVVDGQWVAAGDVLVRLENPELEHDLAELEVAIEQSRARVRAARVGGELAAAAVEETALEALRSRRDERAAQRDALWARAPVAGRVRAENLDSLAGAHVPAGGKLLSLRDPGRLELVLSLAPHDVDALRRAAATGDASAVWSARAPGGPRRRVDSTGLRYAPRADVALPHPALTTLGGGALAVRKAGASGAKAPPGAEATWELCEPRVTARLPLPAEPLGAGDAAGWRAGQVVSVCLDGEPPRLGAWLWSLRPAW